ncbi:MAG: sugar transferase [Desulfuromonadales bacterium GWD2_61_12]|nr:MAG: sugar transferase [Desulfuromonadales bacterium GWC2_61_20]OGR36543.1 MAG: sugar transferase [Desulfuromonadales bacterium GWD2_61_12]
MIVSVLLLFLLAPLLTALAWLIRNQLGRGVLFRQQRPGLHGRPFAILKFRTMTDARDAAGYLLPDGARLTPFGAFLRQSSLDELPELFNVLKGEMSLVGPRPLLMRYLPYYTARERRRHDVRPGITGWAQVHGRNFLPWNARLALDVWYVEHQSIILDLKILLLTVRAVLSRQGAAANPDEVETDLDQERYARMHKNIHSGDALQTNAGLGGTR